MFRTESRSPSMLRRRASLNGAGTIAITRFRTPRLDRPAVSSRRRGRRRRDRSKQYLSLPGRCRDRQFALDHASGVPNFGVFKTANMLPTNYVAGADGPFSGQIPGQVGIDFHSKDLAFELYTVQVPEPAASLLLVCGSLGLALSRRRRRG